MFTIGLAMKLRPGAYEKYKRAHDDLWPEVAASMRSNKVSMAIFRDGDRLFLFASAPDEKHWERSREHPILSKWHPEMARLLETDGQGNIAFTLLPKAFGFGDFGD